MGKVISSILSGGLVIAFFLFATEKTFSQISQDDQVADTTKSGKSSYVKGITPMRARALVGGVLGLASLIIGWRARKRAAAGIGNKGKNGAIVALLLGAISFVLSIIHLIITSGAVFGSGSGKAGAIFALVLSLIGMTLGGLVLRQKKV